MNGINVVMKALQKHQDGSCIRLREVINVMSLTVVNRLSQSSRSLWLIRIPTAGVVIFTNRKYAIMTSVKPCALMKNGAKHIPMYTEIVSHREITIGSLFAG